VTHTLKHAQRTFLSTTSKASPRQQQDWFLKCLQGGIAHPLAVCGLETETLLRSTTSAIAPSRVRVSVMRRLSRSTVRATDQLADGGGAQPHRRPE
jgi:hypothetical protein